MQAIQWTDSFAIGIDEIDAQHRQLVDMISALETQKDNNDAATTCGLLRQLGDQVDEHFALEERLMELGHFDPEFVARHRGEHAYFRGTLKDFTADCECGRRAVNSSLIEYFVHWLLHHFVVIDRDMARQHHAVAPEIAAKILAQAKNLTDSLAESERQLIKDLLRANAELTSQLNTLRQALK